MPEEDVKPRHDPRTITENPLRIPAIPTSWLQQMLCRSASGHCFRTFLALVFPKPTIESRFSDPEHLGGQQFIALRFSHSIKDRVALDFDHRLHSSRSTGSLFARRAGSTQTYVDLCREINRLQPFAAAQSHRSFHEVFELPHISRPRVALQQP